MNDGVLCRSGLGWLSFWLCLVNCFCFSVGFVMCWKWVMSLKWLWLRLLVLKWFMCFDFMGMVGWVVSRFIWVCVLRSDCVFVVVKGCV